MIRDAVAEDADAIVAIYNHYVENTTITFEEEPVSAEEMRSRIEKNGQAYAWLVYEENGRILGYAYASKWRERSAYRFSAEATVYVDKNALHRGIGRSLYSALLPRLKAKGVHLVLGVIALPNEGSVGLHESMGFMPAGRLPEVGFKFDRWIDVGHWALSLRSRMPLIESVTGGPAVATVRALIREYSAFLGADLSFQALEDELSSLPGKYAPPSGALFLASVQLPRGGAEPAGCVALRKLETGVCEMKRLFVRPEYRGCGVGKALAARVVQAARELGYERMRLDTLERLGEAVSLYRSMGFRTIDPYCDNPLEGAMFWEKDLTRPD